MTGPGGLLVSPAALAGELASESGPVLLDVRWRLGGPPGLDSYREGHLPGAVFTDLEHDLAARPGPAGRHPLPDPAAFTDAMRAAGVSEDRPWDAAGAQDVARTGLLLDARAGERYRGEHEPVDPVAGHIPGAVSAPTGDNVNPDGTFRDAAELAARFAVLAGGADPRTETVGVYCGSGVTAAHEVLALALAGLPAALYVGSWSNWITDPARPVATGG